MAVSNADEAVRVLKARPDIRVVFTEIDMHGAVDGLSLAALIRDRRPPIELIIISGRRTSEGDEIPARRLFIAKPYKRHEVTDALRRIAG